MHIQEEKPLFFFLSWIFCISKLFLMAEHLKTWARGKMVQNEGLNLTVIQLDLSLSLEIDLFSKNCLYISAHEMKKQ